ncbi:unnamed protein product, partial [Effrenium voratum]
AIARRLENPQQHRVPSASTLSRWRLCIDELLQCSDALELTHSGEVALFASLADGIEAHTLPAVVIGRWGSIAFCVLELCKLERILRHGWDLAKYRRTVAPAGVYEGGVDAALTWAESCPCHGHLLRKPWAEHIGSPELATGDFGEVLEELTQISAAALLTSLPALPDASGQLEALTDLGHRGLPVLLKSLRLLEKTEMVRKEGDAWTLTEAGWQAQAVASKKSPAASTCYLRAESPKIWYYVQGREDDVCKEYLQCLLTASEHCKPVPHLKNVAEFFEEDTVVQAIEEMLDESVSEGGSDAEQPLQNLQAWAILGRDATSKEQHQQQIWKQVLRSYNDGTLASEEAKAKAKIQTEDERARAASGLPDGLYKEMYNGLYYRSKNGDTTAAETLATYKSLDKAKKGQFLQQKWAASFSRSTCVVEENSHDAVGAWQSRFTIAKDKGMDLKDEFQKRLLDSELAKMEQKDHDLPEWKAAGEKLYYYIKESDHFRDGHSEHSSVIQDASARGSSSKKNEDVQISWAKVQKGHLASIKKSVKTLESLSSKARSIRARADDDLHDDLLRREDESRALCDLAEKAMAGDEKRDVTEESCLQLSEMKDKLATACADLTMYLEQLKPAAAAKASTKKIEDPSKSSGGSGAAPDFEGDIEKVLNQQESKQ